MSGALLALGAAALAGLGFGWLQRRQAVRARRELQAARQEAEQAREQASNATRARDGFFDLATHELRSPLAAILGYQELIQDGAYPSLEDASEPMTRIGRSATHLLHLIEGVVDLSRIRAGGLEPDLEPVNLQDVAGAVTASFRELASERGIEVTTRTTDAGPTVLLDQERVLRAADMLITSAVKHPADHSLHMTVEYVDHQVRIGIRETAIHQRTDSDDPALRIGIRLAIAHGTARLFHGDLDLDVEDDMIRGLSFHIDAPPGNGATL